LKRLLLLILVGCAAGTRTRPPPAPSPEAAALEDEAELFRQAAAAFQQKDLALASQKLQAAIDAPVFSRLTSAQQHAFLLNAGTIANASQHWPQAHAFFVRASALPEADGNDWLGRAWSAWAAEPLDLVLSVTRLAQVAPEMLSKLDDSIVFQTVYPHPKTPDEEQARFQLLGALFTARWKTKSNVEPDEAWRDLAIFLLERNARERAAEVSNRITDPLMLVAMRVDNRFADLVRENPGHFDIDKMQAHRIERFREEVASQPRSLQVLVQYLGSLSSAGRYQKVLDLADEAITRADASRVPPYDDIKEYLSWIRYARAKAVLHLGRWPQAVEELERARRMPEHGKVNVSQSINLGELYCRLDRPKEALEVIAPITNDLLSKYGRMELEGVRLRAATQMGDAAAAAQALNWLREHHKDAEASFQEELIMAGELEQAASFLVDRLKDPRRRSEALLELQQFIDLPATPRDKVLQRRWESVVARADVQAAIAKVGKVERFNIAPQPR
jgi:tetratricopeptide (TPR) repeat protein